MAAGSLLALLDDIATILDDVSLMTKVAAKKTAGVLGDDLALNAEQVVGVKADRELPVVWAVAKGSLLNKTILVPVALLISAFAPWLVTPLLMVGGTFLCYEGAEKLAHRFLHGEPQRKAQHEEHARNIQQSPADAVRLEKDKIRGAIRTDFILSAEIIAITLGVVQGMPVLQQFVVLAGIGLLITAGVYGLVAGIVRLDDLGLALTRRDGKLTRRIGRTLLVAAPWLMKLLSWVGTVAMFLVGGGILVHGLPFLEHTAEELDTLGALFGSVGTMALNAVVGLVVGAVVLGVVTLIQRLRRRPR